MEKVILETINPWTHAHESQEVDYDAVVNLMDDDIRESLHDALAPCTAQVFVDAYQIQHFLKYGSALRI